MRSILRAFALKEHFTWPSAPLAVALAEHVSVTINLLCVVVKIMKTKKKKNPEKKACDSEQVLEIQDRNKIWEKLEIDEIFHSINREYPPGTTHYSRLREFGEEYLQSQEFT